MKKFANVIALIAGLSILSFGRESHAGAGDGGFMLGISTTKLDESYDGTTVGTTETTRTILDLKAGYVMPSGLYFGGIYDSRTDQVGSSKTERTGVGATVGYHNMGWFIDGSYYLTSEIKLSSGTKLESGSGFGVDVGKNFDVLQNVYLGLQIAYKSLEYKKAGGVEVVNKLKSELAPMINAGINF